MIAWMTAKLAEIQQLVQAGLAVAAIVFIAHIWWKTKAVIPTLGAFLLAGAVLWGTSNIGWIENQIGQEARSGSPTAPSAPAAPSTPGP